GGLVLGLLILPTIIMASQAALQAVPQSVRNAALGIGATRAQTVFHHILPLAAPGIITGAIIGMARALGETAPLLLIGMVAFVNEVPTSPNQEATVLPVLIFKWFSGAERAWEPLTSALVLVLVGFLIIINLIAVAIRLKFDRK
ncbi:MAG: ABC transporter permease subunit, partial [Henriciella sp.]